VPAPLAESLHAWSVIADATSGSAASPTNTFIADANLATNGFGLFYAQNPGDAVIVDPFAGLAGNYAWYLAGIPQTYSNTHLKLTIRDKAGNATSITSPLFNVIDQGDLRTSAWRYVTVYILNSNFFPTPPVTMNMILQPFGAQPASGEQFWLDEIEIFTWDEVLPEPAALAALTAGIVCLCARRRTVA